MRLWRLKRKRERDLDWLKGWRRGGGDDEVYTRTAACRVFCVVSSLRS